MVQIDGKLYLVGGWNEINGNRTLVNTIDVYDLQSQSWSVLTTVPNPKYHAGITNVGDRIYIIGGFCSDGESNKNLTSLLVEFNRQFSHQFQTFSATQQQQLNATT
jgi:N-acetylneuraminic acid mutarotase